MKRQSLVILVLAIFCAGFFVGCGAQGKKVSGVADEESQVLDEAKYRSSEELPTTYLVEEGDKLWEIAEKAEIYGNQWQWPLVYDANRDILTGYDSLEEGMKLIIPRNVSAVEIESAKERAMELGIPPGSKAVAEEENIAGLSDDSYADDSGSQGYINAGESTESDGAGSYVMDEYPEEEPTPIPAPVKAKKKGGSNILGIIIGLLLVLAALIIFIFFRQKKKEEESEEEEKESSNILS
ncbi:MAG TPA: LysM peptidoglycan-binding domain-containing protein [Firmicutes bacterium]|nr:LysM peptidoglycan-binding domain-containing protein [Bacillota bacterium]